MKPNRSQRVGELIKREIARVLSSPNRISSDYFYTVTEVRLSRNLQYANIWVSVYGDHDARMHAMQLLKDASGKLRKHISRSLYLRHTPELRFELDETLDRAERIDSILREQGINSDIDSNSNDDAG